MLERVERFRALSEAISAEQAIARTTDYNPTRPRTGRGSSCRPATGSTPATGLPPSGLKLADTAVVFPELAQANTPDRIAALCNPPPGEAVGTGDDGHARWHVIDRGTWARFFRRHLLQAADETYHFLQDKWGVHDDARQFRAQVAPLLHGLTLYPLCLEHLDQPDRAELLPRATDLVNQHPEWVSDGAWAAAAKLAPGGAWSSVGQTWFSPRLPTGTVYGFDWRTAHDGFLPPPTAAESARYHDIAPFKYSVCRDYLTATAPDHRATAEGFKAVMGAPPSYYLPAIWGEAYLVQDDPARYGPLLNQAGALDPEYYLKLGKYYLDHHREPEAA